MGLLDKLEQKAPIKEQENNKEPVKRFLTIPDKIYYLVNDSKVITLKEISNNLGLPYKQIEEYSKLLDKQGLAKLYYPAIGSPRLISIEPTKEKVKLKNKRIRLIIFTILAVIIAAFIVYLLQTGILLR